MKNRVGKFSIDRWLYDDSPEAVADILSAMRFVPMRAEFMLHEQRMELIGLSPSFEEHVEGMPLPRYEIEVAEREDADGKKLYFLNAVTKVEYKSDQ